MEKKILVTGASGYIGSTLVPFLIDRGYHVVAVDRFFFGDHLENNPKLTKLKTDSRLLTASNFDDVYAVIDLVAISNDPSGELFQEATMSVNRDGRFRCAKLAKENGVKRYILPSSCSIYGFQQELVSEKSTTNALTTYAKANEEAEQLILPLSDTSFCVTVIRQATIYGYSPRMRFDLAINGMVLGAVTNKSLPLMRDGNQYRPMLHVKDTAEIMCQLLIADIESINGQIFNAGSNEQNYKLKELANIVIDTLSRQFQLDVELNFYGDPDHRSYQVDFSKLKRTLNWTPQWDAEKAVFEIAQLLIDKKLIKTPQSITMEWYKLLHDWDNQLNGLKINGKLL